MTPDSSHMAAVKPLSWERILGQVKAFQTTEGRLPQTTAPSSREVGLGLWLREQQRTVSKSRISPYREQRFKESGLAVMPHAAAPMRMPGYTAPTASAGQAHASLQCLVDKEKRLVLQGKALAARRHATRAEAKSKAATPVPLQSSNNAHPLVARLAEFDAYFVDQSQPDAVAEMTRNFPGQTLWVVEGGHAAECPTAWKRCQPDRLGDLLGSRATGAASVESMPRHVVLVNLGQQGMVNALGALSRLRDTDGVVGLPGLAVLGGTKHRNLCRLFGVPERPMMRAELKSSPAMQLTMQAA